MAKIKIKLFVVILSLIMLTGITASSVFGLTESLFVLTENEKEYLNKLKDTPITFAISNQIMFFEDESGSDNGVLLPLFNLLENEWRLNINVVNPNWSEAFSMLDSNEIDLLGLVTMNETLHNKYLHTDSLFKANLVVYTRNEDRLGNPVNLTSKKIGSLKNSEIPPIIGEYLPPRTVIQYYDTVEHMFSALSQGEIDCVFSSLNVQGEILSYPNISYETSLENVIASQAVFSNNPKMEGLINIINRYLKNPKCNQIIIKGIEDNRQKSALKITQMHFADDIKYMKEHYTTAKIYDSMVLYPLSYVEKNVRKGFQVDINNMFSKLTEVPVETLNAEHFRDGFISAIVELRNGDILGATGIYYNSNYAMNPEFDYSTSIMTDSLSFFTTGDPNRPLENLRVGTTLFGKAYMDWYEIIGQDAIVFGNRADLFDALKNGKIDAAFMSDMSVDYYYTISGDYTLRKMGTISVPANLKTLLNPKNESFNRLYNASINLLEITNPLIREQWMYTPNENKFEFMRLRTKLNHYQRILVLVLGVIAFILGILFFIVVSQMKKLRVYEQERANELQKIANTDFLTALLNRRAMDNHLCEREKIASNSFILLLDIDKFKIVNDCYGHETGDEVLKLLAQTINKTCPNFIASRWGGEEFLLVLDVNTLDQAVELANQLRINISKEAVELNDGRECKITISGGIAQMHEGEIYTEAVSRADKAMYTAKQSGRNCIKVSE